MTEQVASDAEGNDVELRPGGARMAVTDDNKAEFVACKCRWVLEGQLREQVHALRRGFELVLGPTLGAATAADENGGGAGGGGAAGVAAVASFLAAALTEIYLV
eukprot:COSAG01_NODE_516_length_16026_cov_63.502857_7_plen_104_part_00